MRRTAVLALLLCAVLPAAAPAKGPPREPDEPPDPRGLTLSGLGAADVRVAGRPTQASIERAVARARPVAVGRAIRRARARAIALAGATGLTLGPAVTVTERDQGFEQGYGGPGRERYCFRRGRGEPVRCRAPRTRVAAVSVTYATAQTSAAALTGRALVLPGIATAPVLPENRRSSPSIGRALLAAQDAATPAALAAGQRAARGMALSAGMRAGALLAVAEVRRPFEDFAQGSFGPGRFCGMARRYRGRGRGRTAPRWTCWYSREVTIGLRLTYAA